MTSDSHTYDRERSESDVPFAHVFSPMSYVGEAAYTAIDESVRFGARFVRAIAVRSKERRTINALSGLDDRILKDIGISRSDIRNVARQTAQNPNSNHRAVEH